MKTADTCCLDSILMTCMIVYQSNTTFASQVDENVLQSGDNKYFAKCIQSMSASESVKDLLSARGNLILSASIFKSSGMRVPLENNEKDRFFISLDASEIYLAEHFLLPYCRLTKLNSCVDLDCEDREVPMKFIAIEGNDVARTIAKLSWPSTSGGYCGTSKNDGCICREKRIEYPNSTTLSSDLRLSRTLVSFRFEVSKIPIFHNTI